MTLSGACAAVDATHRRWHGRERFAECSRASTRCAWLLPVASDLALGGHVDVAVRDIVMSIAAFTLARGLEVTHTAPARSSVSTARLIIA